MYVLTLILSVTLGISAFGAPRKSRYQALLQPLDLYAIPAKGGTVMSKAQYYSYLSKNGLPIKLAQQDYRSATETFSLAYSRLNIPLVTAFGNYSVAQTVTTYPTKTNTTTFGLALSGNTGWGLAYTLDLPRVTSTVTSYDNYFSELDTFSMGGTVTFSLLKGSPWFLGRNTKDQADLVYQASRETLRSTTISSLTTGETEYYSVILKQVRVKVLEQALELARALLDDVREMAASGETDRLSVVKVELQVAQTETDLLSAQSDYATAKQILRNTLALKGTDTDVLPDPNEIRQVSQLPDLSIPSNLEKAKKSRPDYLSALLNKKRVELEVEATHSAILPTLDVSAGYGYAATGASIAESAALVGRLGAPQYSIGATFSYSLFNDADKSAHRQAKIRLQRAEFAIEQLNNQVNKEVISAIQNVDLGSRRLRTSELARSLSEKRLAAEFEKFRVGESSIRNIIDFQTDVNNARIAEVSARVDVMTQLATLRLALGELPPGVLFRENP